MIGLDSNIILRALTDDDPAQSPIARRILESLTVDQPGCVNLVVLAEVAWTLDRRYRYPRQSILRTIERLLETTVMHVEQRDIVGRAVTRAHEDALEFADALLCELNMAAGCSTTLTFDRRAASTGGFALAT